MDIYGELLFRGKRIEEWPIYTGVISKWIFGGYVFDKVGTYIYDPTMSHSLVRVDPSTVGQYVRRRDVSGERIFTGDIVQDTDGEEYVVWWSNEMTGYVLAKERCFKEFRNFHENQLKIVGNVWDNSDLKYQRMVINLNSSCVRRE